MSTLLIAMIVINGLVAVICLIIAYQQAKMLQTIRLEVEHVKAMFKSDKALQPLVDKLLRSFEPLMDKKLSHLEHQFYGRIGSFKGIMNGVEKQFKPYAAKFADAMRKKNKKDAVVGVLGEYLMETMDKEKALAPVQGQTPPKADLPTPEEYRLEYEKTYGPKKEQANTVS